MSIIRAGLSGGGGGAARRFGMSSRARYPLFLAVIAAQTQLAVSFGSEVDFNDPNQVKVVVDDHGLALYFSRSPIPWNRDLQEGVPRGALKHLGMYAYRSEFLQKYARAKPVDYKMMAKVQNGFKKRYLDEVR